MLIDWQWVSRWTKILGRFTSVQILVQLVNALTGFMLIRMLGKQEYAWFTLASAGMAIANIMADSGISNAIPALGGPYWNDRVRFSVLMSTALRLRPLLLASSCLLSLPVTIWIMRENGAPVGNLAIQCLLLVALVWPCSTTIIMNSANRLHSRVGTIQQLDLMGAVVRAVWCGGAALIHLDAVTAVSGNLVAQVAQWLLVRKQAHELMDESAASGDECRRALKKKLLHLYPLFVFYALQGQVGTFLISLSATTDRVADLGALSRLGVIFMVLGAPVAALVGPAFSRAKSLARLRQIFLQVVGLHAALSLVIALGCWFFPQPALWVLGGGYAHLERELFWFSVSSGVAGVSSIVWGLCTLRGWTRYAWLNVPAVIGSQVAGVLLFSISSVMGVVWFNMFTTATSLLVGIWIAWVESRCAAKIEHS